MRLLRISNCIIILFVAIIGYSCNSNIGRDVVLTEIQRISSKDNKVDAVLMTTDVDATTSTASHLFIVKKGDKVAKDHLEYAVFTRDHNSKIDISWSENKKLIISYDKARIFKYTNFWNDEDVDDWKYVVEIFLNCKSTDHQL